MASSIDRVKQSIRERLEELDAEREQLMRALEALTGPGGASVGGRRGRPPGSGSGGGASRGGGGGGAKRAAAGKRAPRGQRRQQVIDALEGGERGPSEIARDLGVNATQVSGLLRQLASEGVVARSQSGKWQLAGAASAGGAGAYAGGGGSSESAGQVGTEAPAQSEAPSNGMPSPEQTDHGEF